MSDSCGGCSGADCHCDDAAATGWPRQPLTTAEADAIADKIRPVQVAPVPNVEATAKVVHEMTRPRGGRHWDGATDNARFFARERARKILRAAGVL